MAEITKLLSFILIALVVFAFVASLVIDGNTANNGAYNTTYPTMAKVQQETSLYQNLSNTFHTQSIQNSAQNGNSILGQLLNAWYGLIYGISVATMSLGGFLDVATSMLQDAGSFFPFIPPVILAVIGIYIAVKVAFAIANAVKGGPL